MFVRNCPRCHIDFGSSVLVRQTVRTMRGLLENLHTFIYLYPNVTVLILAKIHLSNSPDVFFEFRILLPY